MTTEESATPVDWRSNSQEPNVFTDRPKRRTTSPDSPTADAGRPETSVMQLSAVLIIILGGMSSIFVIAAIILSSAAHG
jgi:hypothetical protein